MKRIVSILAVFAFLATSGLASAQTVCQQAATHSFGCWQQFCAVNVYSPMCDDASGARFEAAITQAVTCEAGAPQATAQMLIGQTCSAMSTAWPTGPSVCEVAASHRGECANQFCVAHPTSPMCSAESLAGLMAIPGSCDPTATAAAGAVVGQTCDQLTAGWPEVPPPTPCELAATHYAGCAEQFCAAHPTSPNCSPEFLSPLTTPIANCTAADAQSSELVTQQSCAQLTADWPEVPPPTPCELAAAHYAACAESFCAAHVESPSCDQGFLAPFTTPLPDCSAASVTAATAVTSQTCDQLTADWPEEPPPSPCELAAVHMRECATAFCLVNTLSPMCSPEALEALNVTEFNCTPEAVVQANSMIESSCVALTTDWPTGLEVVEEPPAPEPPAAVPPAAEPPAEAPEDTPPTE